MLVWRDMRLRLLQLLAVRLAELGTGSAVAVQPPARGCAKTAAAAIRAARPYLRPRVVGVMTDDIDRSDELLEMYAEDERREYAQRNGYHPDDPGPPGPPPGDEPAQDAQGGAARG